MKKESLVSIVVPYYNTKIEFLDYCMNSLLNQTYKNIEIILVDDGSKKEFSNLLDEKWGNNNQVKIFHKENKGVSEARNFGTKKALGTYILYVDSDDMLAPYAVEDAIAIALCNGADIVYGRIISISNYDKEIEDFVEEEIVDVLKDKEASKRLISHIFTKNDAVWENKDLIGEFNGEGPWAKLVKRECAQRVSFPVGIKIGEDTIWNILILEQDLLTVCVSNRVWYYYYQNQQGAINTFSKNKMNEVKKQIQYLNNYIYNNQEYMTDYFKWLQIKIKNQLIYGFFLNNENTMTRKEKKIAFRNTIHSEPWNIIKGFSKLSLKDSVWKEMCWRGILLGMYDIKRKINIFKSSLCKEK